MPIYMYSCENHGNFEMEQKITEDPLEKCPHQRCQKKPQRLIANTSFALKGQGWYETDYKRKA
jgi:putative FmdB family regulatory protein